MTSTALPHPRVGTADDAPSLVGRALLAVAGVGFALFPLLRPFGDKSGSAAATAGAFADPRWVVSHGLAMVAFVALALALRLLRRPRLELPAWLGAAFVLPYYGGETFALHAIGAHALPGGDSALLAAGEAFRDGAVAMTTFALGLLLLAAVGVGIARSVRGGVLARVAGALVAVGLMTYLPQFFLPPAGRIAHGLVLGIGLVLLATLWRLVPAVDQERLADVP